MTFPSRCMRTSKDQRRQETAEVGLRKANRSRSNPRLVPRPRLPGPDRVKSWRGLAHSHPDALRSRLALRPGNRPSCLAGDLRDHAFLLVFGQVLDQQVVGALQLRVAVNLLHDTFPDALLAVDFAHFVQDNRAFEAVAGHGLDVSPIFWGFFYVGINLRVHFRVDPKSGLIRGGGIAARARWRWGVRFVHKDSF